MAGEYSRELSAKVFAGQGRLIEHGYRQGGPAGFGLRRMLIDEHGSTKGLLDRGEHKSIQTDRVILTPGPDEEIGVVRNVYHAFVHDRCSEREIADSLNQRGILTDLGRAWTRGTVHQLLINEKYVGDNVWNRLSFKLKQKRVRNDPGMWIRANGVFEAVIDRDLFEAARTIIGARSFHLSDADMLGALKQLFEQQGLLSGLIIDESHGLPSSSAYRSRFGSLLRAYSLVGYTPDRDYRYIEVNRALRRLHPEMVTSVKSGLTEMGSVVVQDPDTDLFQVNGEFSLSVVIARCNPTTAGSLRWRLRLDNGLLPDISIAVRMDVTNRAALDYYLLPRLDLANTRLKLAEDNGLGLDAYRFDSLDVLYGIAAPICMAEVA